ncbi:MAG: AMP-binding protein [Panacagrimonas sp.]
MDPTGAAEWIRRRMLRDSARPALSFERETLSYGAMQQRIERLSAVLAAGGLCADDRVAFLGINHSLIPITLFAAARLGAIFVPLNFVGRHAPGVDC